MWVVNSSPLIVLGKAGLLELLAELAGSLIVPMAVFHEVTVRKAEASLMAFLEHSSRVQIKPNVEHRPEILAWDLGSGESQAISMAALMGAERVVLDDLEARRCANSLNISVIGSLGIVVKAKQKGLISEAKAIIERLRRVGLYLDDGLVAKALEMVGE